MAYLASGQRVEPPGTLFGRRMNLLIRSIGGVAMLLLVSAALARPLACPATAPAEWGAAHARLESIRVLSFRAGGTRDEDTALPIMAPAEWERAGVLYQTWNMNVDAPAFTSQVDCLFSGTTRYVRLDAGSVKRCLAKQHLRSKAFSFRCD